MKVFLLIILIILILNGLAAISVIIFERKKPEKTIAWTTLILLIPIAGLLGYILFGRNWRTHTSYSSDVDFSKYINYDSTQSNLPEEYMPMVRLLSGNSESPVFYNNEVTVYQDGNEMFSRMKEELLKAKHHIHLEYYTVRSDELGNEIQKILIKKSSEGVKIRFIIDCSGSAELRNSYIKELRDAGADVILYCCFKSAVLRNLSTHALYRDHRKITIIDGETVFIGGNNVGNEYLGRSKFGFWRDTHLMVRGNFVHGVQTVFLNNFLIMKKVHGEDPRHQVNFDEYFPAPYASGTKTMQLVRSGPESRYYSTLQCMLKMIALAKQRIYITVPYFIPPQSLKEALKMAVLKGIEVTILFPDQCDHMFMHHASKSHLFEMIEYGVKVYLYDKTAFIHAKVITIDGRFCTVGSTNMDHYSFEYNYEINAVIYDNQITSELEKQFLEDLNHSHQMTENYYNEIPSYTKAFQNIARVLSGIL